LNTAVFPCPKPKYLIHRSHDKNAAAGDDNFGRSLDRITASDDGNPSEIRFQMKTHQTRFNRGLWNFRGAIRCAIGGVIGQNQKEFQLLEFKEDVIAKRQSRGPAFLLPVGL
jgi:hypothetical protein